MNGARLFDFKVVITGDSFVGKTTMLKKYLGVSDLDKKDYVRHTVKKDGEDVVLQIYDTMGQERYKSLTRPFYRGAHGCLVCFDVQRGDSFDNVKHWFTDLSEYAPDDIQTVLVGIENNKSTRSRVSRETRGCEELIPNSRIDSFCTEHRLQYMGVDLQSKAQIDQVFGVLVDLMLACRNRKSQELVDFNILKIETEVTKQKSCSCN